MVDYGTPGRRQAGWTLESKRQQQVTTYRLVGVPDFEAATILLDWCSRRSSPSLVWPPSSIQHQPKRLMSLESSRMLRRRAAFAVSWDGARVISWKTWPNRRVRPLVVLQTQNKAKPMLGARVSEPDDIKPTAAQQHRHHSALLVRCFRANALCIIKLVPPRGSTRAQTV